MPHDTEWVEGNEANFEPIVAFLPQQDPVRGDIQDKQ